MKSCPACNENGISIFDLASTDKARPSKCKACGSLFYMPAKWREPISFVYIFGFVPTMLAALFISSWWPVICFVVLVPSLFLSASYYCQPVQTDEAAVNKSKNYRNIVFLILLLLFLASVLHENL